tara:strand:+ start:767 stop:1135 length:369 start_codon:yes stop_codon:yes gene_type:complete
MKTYSQFSEGLKDYSNQGKNVRVPGEDTASFIKLFKDDLRQTGKFKNPTTGKLEGGIFPNLKKGYQVRQFLTGRGGLTRTLNPFLGKGQGLRSGPTPLARQTPRLTKQAIKKIVKFAFTKKL